MTVGVVLKDVYYFKPANITVVIGLNNTVRWVNNDTSGEVHTVTSNTGLFDSGKMVTNAVFTCTFTVAGTYNYHCIYHALMVGTVFVKAP